MNLFLRCTRTSMCQIQKLRISTNVIDTFSGILGSEYVKTTDAVRDQHAKDESHFRAMPPDVVLFPGSNQETAECVKVCHRENLYMIPFGTGTGLEAGISAIHGGVCFNLGRMDRILDLHTEDFDVTVEPGVTRKALDHHLKDYGLWFPIDPGADASLCGMAATSASGTNAVRYGTMKDNVINLEVILADGTILNTAGPKMRARKTSAGYNLTNLFVGSEGTLGIITKATLKLYGIPEAAVAAVCQFPNVETAVETTINTLQAGIPIARIEFLDEVQMRACIQYSHLEYEELPTLFLEFSGSPKQVEEQAQLVEELATGNGGSNFQWAETTEGRNKLWTARHNALYAAKTLRPSASTHTTDVCVPLTKLAEVIKSTKQDIEESGFVGPIVGHVGDGNFHVLLMVDKENEDETKAVKKLTDRMAERAILAGGTCTGEHGIGLGKRHLLAKELGPEEIHVMKQIKATLDPKGLLNPGKLFL